MFHANLLFGKSRGLGKVGRCSDSDMMIGAVLDDDDDDDDDASPVISSFIHPVLMRRILSIFSTRGLMTFLLELGGSLVNCCGTRSVPRSPLQT